MVVVVARPGLVQRRAAVDGDPAQQPRLGQVREAVVDRLMRDPGQHRRDRTEHRRGAGVRRGIDRLEHRHALARGAQAGSADDIGRRENR